MPDLFLLPASPAANPEQAVTMLFTDEADVAAGWSSLSGDAAKGYSFGVFTRMVVGRGAGDGPPQDRLEVAADPVRAACRAPRPAGRAEDPDRRRPHGDGDRGARCARRRRRSSIGGGGFVPVTANDYAVIAGLVVAGAGHATGAAAERRSGAGVGRSA